MTPRTRIALIALALSCVACFGAAGCASVDFLKACVERGAGCQ